jgi:hypothetical protein
VLVRVNESFERGLGSMPTLLLIVALDDSREPTPTFRKRYIIFVVQDSTFE